MRAFKPRRIQNILLFVFIGFILHVASSAAEDRSTAESFDESESSHEKIKYKQPRYLLYDVNPGEGFNLRRDVYLRIANLVRLLNEHEPWTLALPPWSNLYHWKHHFLPHDRLPWSSFFDVPSLSKFVPVIEFKDFIEITGKREIEQQYYLQHYEEGWNGEWIVKIDERPCLEGGKDYKKKNGVWKGYYWGYGKVYSLNFKCLSAQAHVANFRDFILSNTSAKSVMINRAETLLHDYFGDKFYWQARRSQRFALPLKERADRYYKNTIGCDSIKDGTVHTDDWRDMKRQHGDAIGCPYLAVHLRRLDFATYAHKETVPSLQGTAKQIRRALESTGLSKVFVASDAELEEIRNLADMLKPEYKVYKYSPCVKDLDKYLDGGIAIIDQIICSYAQHFIGTHESTFSFRIQEEREILGFHPNTTFNRFCGDNEPTDCEQPAHWTISYDLTYD